MIAAVTLIATGISGSTTSGAAVTDRTSTASGGQARPVGAVAPEHCPDARRGLVFYRTAYDRTLARMGRAGETWRRARGCIAVRYLAAVARTKARAARRAFARWRAYHYDWRSWLPDKWARIGACETGYGVRPGRWDWNSGAYQGAFGFAVSSWDGFVPHADPKAGPYPSEAYLATPRQQYEVALAIWRRYGFSGWGCRGA